MSDKSNQHIRLFQKKLLTMFFLHGIMYTVKKKQKQKDHSKKEKISQRKLQSYFVLFL